MADDDALEISDRQPMPTSRASHRAFLIADDHPSVTMAVGLLLAQVVGTDAPAPTFFTRSDALLAACALPSPVPRIVITDLVMPGPLKRTSLVHALHEAAPDARILVYTAEGSAFLAQAVQDAGALGFVAKTSLSIELIGALKAMLAGQRYVDRNIDISGTAKHPWRTLTDSERTILLAFARGSHANDIVTATGRSYSTVTTHKYNGLKKLALRDSSDVLSYLHIHGLVYELDGDLPYERASS